MSMLKSLLLSALALFLSSTASASPLSGGSPSDEYQLTFNSSHSSPFLSDWIPLKVQNSGHVIFDAYVDGTKVRALLDTGASHSIIDLALAKKLGLTQTGSMPITDLSGVVTTVPMFADSTIVAGGRSIVGLPIWGMDLSTFQTGGIDVDFVLGMDIMKHGGLMLAMSQRQMRFLPEGSRLNEADAELPLRFSDDGQKIGVELPLPDGENVPLMLDTGMDSGLLLSDQLFKILMPSRPRTTISGGSLVGQFVNRVFFSPELPVGKTSTSNVLIVQARAEQLTVLDPFKGNLGMGMLSQFDSVFDFKSKKWFIAKRYGLLAPDPRTLIGIQTTPDEAALRVVHVMSGSPAEKAGFKIGDRICKTDGQDALTEFFQRQMMPYNKGPIGKKKTYELCDGGIRELVTAEFY